MEPTPPPSAESLRPSFIAVQPSPEFSFSRLDRSKSAKRPVAFDFVDVDDRFPLSNGESSNTIRRSEGFGMDFSSVRSTRRCVIDLSDSEDDEIHHRDRSEFSRRSHIAPNLRSQQGNNHLLRQSSHKAGSVTVTPSPDPAALQSEINSLREKIEIFEEKRKRKQVSQLDLAFVGAVKFL